MNGKILLLMSFFTSALLSALSPRAVAAAFAAAAASASASAEESDTLSCRPGQSFYKEIYNCGKNELAATYGRECSDSLLRNSNLAGSALARQMKEAEKFVRNGQSAEMDEAKKRLISAVETLEAQIKQLQVNTAVVAAYPQVMIDYPDGVDDETSAGCFSEAFDDLQDIVSGLDREILRAKKAREKALALLAGLAAGTADLTSLNEAPVGEVSAGKRPDRGNGHKGKAWNDSDISGTEKVKRKKK